MSEDDTHMTRLSSIPSENHVAEEAPSDLPGVLNGSPQQVGQEGIPPTGPPPTQSDEPEQAPQVVPRKRTMHPTLSQVWDGSHTPAAAVPPGSPTSYLGTRDSMRSHGRQLGLGPGAPVREFRAVSKSKVNARRTRENTKEGDMMRALTVAEMLAQGLPVPKWPLFKYRTQKVMQGNWMTLIMLLLTVWALFAADIQIMSATKSADPVFEGIAVTLFIIFMLELVVNSLTQSGYFLCFFWWLDLIAALSMLLDVESIRNAVLDQEDTDLTVARAGRAARAGTRAGRLLKMTRLLRVIKLFRTVKRDRSAEPGELGGEENANSLGPKVAEMTTNKVVLGVLILLVTLPQLSPQIINTGPSFALSALYSSFDATKGNCTATDTACTRVASDPARQADCQHKVHACRTAQSATFTRLLDDFERKYKDDLLELNFDREESKPTCYLMVPKKDRRNLLRSPLEIRREAADKDLPTKPDALAVLDDKEKAEDDALLSCLTTLLVVVVLGAGATAFGKDATKFSDRIVEPMQALCEDMAHVANMDYIDVVHPPCGIVEVRDTQASFQRMKGGLRTFARYVPNAVVKQITVEGVVAELAIQEREMSFFFCDIQGFTTVCEAMNSRPDDLLKFLSEFFTEMAAIVEDTGGTLIEYIGDAILACWNDRSESPVPDHAFAAASASFRMRMRLEELHPVWQKKYVGGPKGAPPIYLRTGVHTGHSWVGYIGSNARMKYGLLGEHVNVAMTLEEINKHYNTFTLISEQVQQSQQVRDTFVMRPVDVIELEGVSKASKLFEIIGIKPGLAPDALYIKPPGETPGLRLTLPAEAPPALMKYFERHTEAMDKFLARDFSGCLEILSEQKDINGEPADVQHTRREEHHRGSADGKIPPHYKMPLGVHPTPPGTWPGPDGDVAAATLRHKCRELLNKPDSFFEGWLGVTEGVGGH